jgi:thiosulfate reductase cytochrome b subunit
MTDATLAPVLTGKAPKRAVMIYSRYERFWHWSQALLIFVLTFSRFGLHGTHALLGFETAVNLHTTAALVLIALWAFTTFWHFTTGQWKQYLPQLSGLAAVIRFYAWGILTGAPHPYSKTLRRKQNALQSLAYLFFMVMIGPALWASGIVYLTYPWWSHWAIGTLGLPAVAFVHTAAAFLMITFVVIHVYMTTTGKTVTHYVKTMITGYDSIELSAAEAAYLEEDQPGLLKK